MNRVVGAAIHAPQMRTLQWVCMCAHLWRPNDDMNASDDFLALETARLLLRPLAAGDLDFIFQHFSDPEVGRDLVDEEPLTTRTEAQAIVDFYVSPGPKTYNRWVIVRKLDRQAIGTCGFHRWSRQHGRAEVGYDLARAAWGQGIMTEALTAVLEHGFSSCS